MFKKLLITACALFLAHQSNAMFFPWDEWDKEDEQKLQHVQQITQPVVQKPQTRTPMPSSRKIAEEMKAFLEKKENQTVFATLISKDDMPILCEMIQKITQKFKFSNVPNIVLMKSGLCTAMSLVLVGKEEINFHTDEELDAILAHEIAHMKKKHDLSSTLLSWSLALALVGPLIIYAPNTMEMIIFSIALWVASRLLPNVPLINTLSRSHEIEADSLGRIDI